MAEASTSTMSQAQVLREAARRTMRRKQAPDLASNRIPTPPLPTRSAAPPSLAASLSTQPQSVSLDYGDPMDISPTTITPNIKPIVNTAVNTSSPVTAMPSRPTRRTSLTAAKNAAAADDASREEGEISDEDIRTRQKASKGMHPSWLDTQTSSDTYVLASKPSPLKPSPNRPTQTPRRDSFAGGMPPPSVPVVSGHREPAPISPSATVPSTTTVNSNGIQVNIRRHSAPNPQTHSFDKLRMDAYTPQANGDDGSLSPKTENLNREFFTKLLEQGVDDKHCRPGLPMTFEQFERAKELILDLLGYGFTPENIAEIGLNRRLVVYCLRELKIRLPGNITVDDIVPYDPPEESDEIDVPTSPPHEDTTPPVAVSADVGSTSVDAEEERQSPSPSPPLTPVNVDPAPSTSTSTPAEAKSIHTKPSSSHLNVNAAPFHPPPNFLEPTGPSLPKMLLRHQTLPPVKRNPPVDAEPSVPFTMHPRPSFLPPRPAFSVDAASSRKSTAGSSSADPVIIAASPLPPSPSSSSSPSSPPVAPDQQTDEAPTEAERVEEQKRMERLEQEKKMVLLRKKLDLKKKQRPTELRTVTIAEEVTVKNQLSQPESTSHSTILGGERVGSPPSMEVDPDPSPSLPSISSYEPIQRLSPTPAETERHNTPSELQKAQFSVPPPPITRSPLPIEIIPSIGDTAPKRGIKRPKADDFVEDAPTKRVTKSHPRTIFAPAPIKRSSFAILNSVPPEQHVIHWIDDESLPEIERPPTGGIFLDPVESTVDSEALKFAAEAIAIGLPMDSSDLEATLLIEERKRKVNEMSIKLLKTQLSLKRLELKKAEKKLRTLQNTNASISLEELAAINRHIQTLADDLTSIKTQLKEYGVEEPSQPSQFPVAVAASRQSENGTPSPLTPFESTSHTPKEENTLQAFAQEQKMEIDTVDTADGLPSLSAINGAEIGNVLPETPGADHGLEAVSNISGQTGTGRASAGSSSHLDYYLFVIRFIILFLFQVTQNQDGHTRSEDNKLQSDAASQSRFRVYEPPLMFSAISSTRPSVYSSDHTEIPTNILEATTQVAQTKFVKADPNRELCQYEQVGGTCRDSECTGLHFKDL